MHILCLVQFFTKESLPKELCTQQNKEQSEEKPTIIPDSKPEVEENTTEKLEIEQKQTKCSSYGTETKFHNPIHKKSASDVAKRSDLVKSDCFCILCWKVENVIRKYCAKTIYLRL